MLHFSPLSISIEQIEASKETGGDERKLHQIKATGKYKEHYLWKCKQRKSSNKLFSQEQ